jgi:hypothetical protein
MSIFAEIIGGGLGKLVKDVVGTFKLPPEEKLKFEAIIEANAHEIQMKEYELQVKAMDAESKAIEQAAQTIRAEAQSGDKYTSRARPTYFYLFYCILFFNFIFLPITQMLKGIPLTDLKPIQFPEIMWEIFIAGFLGYVGFRSWEKVTTAKNGGKK